MSEEVKETMEDYASELEASYKEFDQRRNSRYEEQDGPDAEKWAELAQMMEDKTANVPVPQAVEEIRTAPIRHTRVCDRTDMEKEVAEILGL